MITIDDLKLLHELEAEGLHNIDEKDLRLLKLRKSLGGKQKNDNRRVRRGSAGGERVPFDYIDGEKLKDARGDREKKQVANYLGIGLRTFENIEDEIIQMTFVELAMLCRLYKVNERELRKCMQ